MLTTQRCSEHLSSSIQPGLTNGVDNRMKETAGRVKEGYLFPGILLGHLNCFLGKFAFTYLGS